MKRTAGQILEEARARTRKLNAKIEAHADYAQHAAEWDAEYAVARAMHEAREQSRLTQREIAERMGVSQPTVSNALRGHVTISTLVRFFAACDRKLVIQSIPV